GLPIRPTGARSVSRARWGRGRTCGSRFRSRASLRRISTQAFVMIVGVTTAARIVVLPGDGIGPEVTEAARRVLEVAATRVGLQLDFVEELVGGASVDAFGVALRPQTLRLCKTADAILFAAVG